MRKEKREEEILRIVRENPGIASFDIRKIMADKQGENDRCIVAHRLTSLWRKGLVRRERVTDRQAKTYRYWIMEASSTIRECVLELVSRNPGIGVNEMVKAIAAGPRDGGASASGVAVAALKLVENGILFRKKIPKEHGHGEFRYWLSGEVAPDNIVDEDGISRGKGRWLSAAQAAEAAGVTIYQWWGLVGGKIISPEIVAGEKKFSYDHVEIVRQRLTAKTGLASASLDSTNKQAHVAEHQGFASQSDVSKAPTQRMRTALDEAKREEIKRSEPAVTSDSTSLICMAVAQKYPEGSEGRTAATECAKLISLFSSL